jgi:20S proteasome subunit beta 7
LSLSSLPQQTYAARPAARHSLRSLTLFCSIRESTSGDAHALSPSQLYAYLTRVMYARRSKVDPLWNSLVIGGVDRRSGVPFLGYVDLLGVTYESATIATGFGMHLAQPLLRKAVEGREETLSQQEAEEILKEAMKVLCE